MERKKVIFMCSILLFFFPTLSKWDNSITITQNQSIKDDETLVSAAETFEAGFFSFGSSKRQYFGIWYKSISPKTIVWVANRDTPVENSTAILKLSDQGNLLIVDGSKGGIVWSSNASRIAKKPFMQLLDSGNLVVKDGDSRDNLLVWESFDHPGDTLLAGMKIKSNLATGPSRSLTSWKDTEDPGAGEFSFRIETHGYPQLLLAKGTKPVARAGPWIGNFDEASQQRLLKILKFIILITGREISYTYERLNSSIVTRQVINPAGSVQRWIWSSGTQRWELISTHPSDQCEYYALCGPNSYCNTDSYPLCECLEGFIPKFQANWDSLDNSGGCVRMKNLSCENNGDGFLKYTGVKLPDTYSSRFDPSMTSLDECAALCLRNCSCTAYAYLYVTVSGRGGCLIWFGDILDMRKVDQGQDTYIRVNASELEHKRNKRNFNTKKVAGALVGIITFIMGISILGLATTKCIKKKKKIEKKLGTTVVIQGKDKRRDEDIDLATIFDFSTISNATNQFSQSNKLGEGGFGSVYKGIFEDGREIAVTRLSNTSEQGTEEFKNEVMLVARLQHQNLVKLIGCSIHQDEKLLIYEFMHNRSLD